MSKYTAANIKYLANCLLGSKIAPAKPYAVLIGAGVSKSAGIPTAPELVAMINADATFSMHLHDLSVDDHKDYGLCMAALTLEDRRRLLDPKLEGAKVNWASLALAALMKENLLRRVLSFNFDNVLLRACGICAHYPAVYDFSMNPPSEFSYLKPGAIIHLHGQGSGLVMLNSKQETEDHAQKLEAIFRDTLANFNLIVIGYSGQADASFAKLSGIFDGRNRVFWLGYEDDPPEHVKKLEQGSSVFHFFGGADADLFLLELGQEVGCWPPKIFSAPEQHLLDEIAPVIAFPSGFPGDNVLENLKSEMTASAKARDEKDDYESLLLRGAFEELIAKEADAKTPTQIDAVSWAYVMQGNALSDLAAQEKSADLYRQSFEKYEAALKIKPDKHEALYNWGIALSDLAKQEKSADLYRQSFEKYEAALKIKPDDHATLNNWGNALSDLAKQEKSADLYRQSFEKFEAALKIKPDNHEALNNLGNGLSDLAKQEKSADLYRQSFEKFEAALKIKPDKHEALNNCGTALSGLWHLTGEEGILARGGMLALQAEKFSGQPSYNLACVLALQGKEAECREQLQKCKMGGTLPDAGHLKSDPDFTAYSDRDWFRDLLDSTGAKA